MMFGGWTIPIGAVSITEPQTPKETLKLSFPKCSITSPHDAKFSKNLYNLFRQIRKLPDITPEHLESLNISLEYDVPLERLIPTYPPRRSASAPASTSTDTTTEASTSAPAPLVKKSYIPDENAEGPLNKTFAERKSELLIPNEHAFETLARLRRDIKLGHFYRFYQTLELVTAYYGKDQAHAGMPEKFREDLVKNFVEPLSWGYNARLLPPRAPPRVQFMTSRFMTKVDFNVYLTPTLPAERKAGLVEGPLFSIQCRHDDYFVYPGGPHLLDDPPEDILVEVSESSTAEESKSGTDFEGDTPMKEELALPAEESLGQGEIDSSANAAGDKTSEAVDEEPTEKTAEEIKKEQKAEMKLAKAEEAKRKQARREEEKKVRMKKGSWPEGDVWDALKEVGALLCTAQERRKGGKGEGGIGKGKVEKKVRFRAIGREDPWWDDVFLLSSIHCHVALSHVRISSAYLRFLETGNLPNPNHELIKDEKSEWCELEVERSQWWDLTKPADRVEAARAVSAVMGFLERNEGSA